MSDLRCDGTHRRAQAGMAGTAVFKASGSIQSLWWNLVVVACLLTCHKHTFTHTLSHTHTHTHTHINADTNNCYACNLKLPRIFLMSGHCRCACKSSARLMLLALLLAPTWAFVP